MYLLTKANRTRDIWLLLVIAVLEWVAAVIAWAVAPIIAGLFVVLGLTALVMAEVIARQNARRRKDNQRFDDLLDNGGVQ